MSQKKLISYDNLVSFYQKLKERLSMLQDKIDNLFNRTTVSYYFDKINEAHVIQVVKLDDSFPTYNINVRVKDKENINDLDVDNTTKNHLILTLAKNQDSWFFVFKIPCVDERSMLILETNNWGTGIIFDKNGTVCICFQNNLDHLKEATLTVYNANKNKINESLMNIQ